MQKLTSIMIGKTRYTFGFEGKDAWEVVWNTQQYSLKDVHECGKCQSKNIYLRAFLSDKGSKQYKYLKVVCGDCKATLTLGRREDDPSLMFYRTTGQGEDRKLDWQVYKK